MSTITKQLLQTLRPEINAALAEVAKRHGISIQAGNAKFHLDGSQGEFKVSLFANADRTIADAKADKQADTLAAYRPLYPDLDLDREFTINGIKLKVTGYNSRARKTPFIAAIPGTNRFYRLSEDDLMLRIKK